jgi:hypothetical protein
MNWKSILAISTVVMVLLGIPSDPARAEIAGSSHDFTQKGWNTTGEVCITCHVPHDGGRDLGDTGLLWNHVQSAATYDLYQGFELETEASQPIGPSKVCLGCHDGTVAIDSFGPNSGSTFSVGGALIGTNLSMTHPISLGWTHKGSSKDCARCHNMHGNVFGGPLKFIKGRVECATCHDPHNNLVFNPGGTSMLRLDNSTSGLCLYCHDK